VGIDHDARVTDRAFLQKHAIKSVSQAIKRGFGDSARDIKREIETVHAMGQRVGDEMDLMLDPACEYETFADALEVGRACDEEGFYWYEDPYRDGGISQHAHRKLAENLETAILQTEHVRGLEPKAHFVAGDATAFVRADPDYDGGVTGAMKTAHMAESFGLDVEFHAPGPAQRHCIAATRNSSYYELALVHQTAPTPRHRSTAVIILTNSMQSPLMEQSISRPTPASVWNTTGKSSKTIRPDLSTSTSDNRLSVIVKQMLST